MNTVFLCRKSVADSVDSFADVVDNIADALDNIVDSVGNSFLRQLITGTFRLVSGMILVS